MASGSGPDAPDRPHPEILQVPAATRQRTAQATYDVTLSRREGRGGICHMPPRPAPSSPSKERVRHAPKAHPTHKKCCWGGRVRAGWSALSNEMPRACPPPQPWQRLCSKLTGRGLPRTYPPRPSTQRRSSVGPPTRTRLRGGRAPTRRPRARLPGLRVLRSSQGMRPRQGPPPLGAK